MRFDFRNRLSVLIGVSLALAASAAFAQFPSLNTGGGKGVHPTSFAKSSLAKAKEQSRARPLRRDLHIGVDFRQQQRYA